MLNASFNQDSTCFSCGTNNGFAVYNCDPLTERFNRLDKTSKKAGGINIVEMLYRSNIFALVGGGESPKYPVNRVMIWDDCQNKCIAELEFKSAITGVKLRKNLILVTIVDKLYLYNFSDLRLIKSIETFNNPRGTVGLSVGSDTIIAIPGKQVGTVLVDNRTTDKIVEIKAHSNPIALVALNNEGDRLATVSERGTMIRIWDTNTGKQIKEFRRGAEATVITSLAFDHNTSSIVVCNKKGTVHIFNLPSDQDSNSDTNKRSTLTYISNYLPKYFSSEWSAISFNVPANKLCTFGINPGTLYIITEHGMFKKYTFDTATSTIECIETVDIMKELTKSDSK